MHGLSRTRLIVVPLLACACHTTSTVPIAPHTSGPLPRHSTVVLVGGDRVPVEDGRTTRDSLIGTGLGGTRYAVHRDSVSFVETRTVSVARTVGAGAGGVLAALSVLIVMGMALALGELQ